MTIHNPSDFGFVAEPAAPTTLTVKRNVLTDGSHVYKVTIANDGQTLDIDAIDESGAVAMAKSILAAIKSHGFVKVTETVEFNY